MLEYRIGDYEEGLKIRQEMATFFKHWADLRNYKWEWQDIPLGSVQYFACDGSRIVGHSGYLAVKLSIGGKECLGAKGEGAFVKNSYRGRNIQERHPHLKDKYIFEDLIGFKLQNYRERFEFVFGFPIGVAMKGETNAGYDLWKTPITVYRRTRCKFKYYLLKFIGRLPPVFGKAVRDIRMRRIRRIEIRREPTDAVVNINRNTGLNRIEYDADYLNWKIYDNPHNVNGIHVARSQGSGNVTGYLIFTLKLKSNGIKVLKINDVKVDGTSNPNTPGVYQGMIIDVVEKYRPDQVYTWFNQNSLTRERHAAFQRLGFNCRRDILNVVYKTDIPDLDANNFDMNMMWMEGV